MLPTAVLWRAADYLEGAVLTAVLVPQVSREEFGTAMKFMFEGLSEEEVDQNVLEVLSFRHSLEHIDKLGKFRSVFAHLDKDNSVRPRSHASDVQFSSTFACIH